MLGRGLRLYPSKDYCLVLDFEKTINREILGASLASLLGLSKNDLKTNSMPKNFESSTAEIQEMKSETALDTNVAPLNFNLRPFLDPFSGDSLAANYSFIERISKFAWIRVKEEEFMIHLASKNRQLKIVPEKGRYAVYQKRLVNGPFGYYQEKSLLFYHTSLLAAIQGADTYILNQIGYIQSQSLSHFASWRLKKASSDQLALLKKWGIGWEGITKGEASDLIMRRTNGATQETKRVRKQAAKQERMSS